MFREAGTQVSPLPSLRTAAPPPCFPLGIKDSRRRMRSFLIKGGF
jgi:hypothetical protein